MSFSAPRDTGPRNPAKKHIEWKAADDQGFFQYYDKNNEDKNQRNVAIELLDFIILDKDLFSVTGYDENLKANVMSNEVRSVDDILTIKRWKEGKATTILQGSYTDLKDAIKSQGLNYTRSIYILMNGEINHVKLSGAAFSAWLNEVEANSNHAAALIDCTGFKDGIKGRVKFRTPTFTVSTDPLTEEETDAATEADKELQLYLKSYFAKNGGTSDASKASAPPAEEEAVDTKKWREVITPSGGKLGSLSLNEIREMQEHLVESGTKGSILDYVGQAIYDYQQANKTWDQKKAKEGKALSDYPLAEIEKMLNQISYNNPAKLFLECAVEAKRSVESPSPFGDDDFDDVPF